MAGEWDRMMGSNKNKAVLNSMTSVGAQIISILFSFFVRRYLVRLCDVEIMGMNGVLNEVVSFLSLFELGISASIVYRLLAPILCDDKAKILKLFTIIKQAYQLNGFIMILICVACVPLLDTIISVETVSKEYVYAAFFILVFGMVSSFVISYYRTVFVAYQRQYFCNVTDLMIHFVFNVLKIIVILWTKNFLIYLFFQSLQGLCGNLIIRSFCLKQYSFLKGNCKVQKAERKVVYADIKDISISKMAGYIYSSTDMSIISAICGTMAAGYISNYKMIFSPLRNIINIFNTALVPTMGSYIQRCEDKQEIHQIFQIYTFFEYLVSVVLIIPVMIIIDYFVVLWLGEEYQIPKLLSFLMGWDIFINCMQEPNVTIMNAVGYFRENKLISLAATLVNVVASIILAYMLGTAGVFMATIAALFIFSGGRSFVIYQKFFQYDFTEYIQYFIGQLGYFLLFGIQLFSLQVVIGKISTAYSIGRFVWICFLCEAIVCGLNFLIWRKNTKYQYIKNIVTGFVKKRKQGLR